MLTTHTHLITYALERGFTISVFTGMFLVLDRSDNEQKIMNATKAGPGSFLHLYEANNLHTIACVKERIRRSPLDTVASFVCADIFFERDWRQAYEEAKAALGE